MPKRQYLFTKVYGVISQNPFIVVLKVETTEHIELKEY